MNTSITIPIKIAGTTLIGVMTKEFPIEYGNCFSLYDTNGKSHRVVNFVYENLKEWIKRTNQKDIIVRCIPKSDLLWEICDDRIPLNWYKQEYCTVCTPLRMLPFEQRKRYVSKYSFTKVPNPLDKTKWYIITYPKNVKSKNRIIIPDKCS